MQFYGLDWLAMASGLTAVYLLGGRNRFGFILFLISSLSWTAMGVLMGSLPVVAGSLAFSALHLRGFLNWSRGEK